MTTPPYEIDVLISAKAIAARVEGLAREIAAHFKGTDKLVVVGLLRGSFVFIADLVRELHLPVEVDFIEVSSYGNSTESSREVRVMKDLRGEIENRDVLLVEDIVDTGHTLRHVLDILATRRLVEQCADLDPPRVPGPQDIEHVPQRMAGIDDVLDDEHVAVLDLSAQVLHDPHFAARFRRVAVTRDFDEIDLDRQVQFAHQVGDEDERAAQ